MTRWILAVCVGLSLCASPVGAQHEHGAAPPAPPPPLYADLGTWSHPITTSSGQAQKYFDQGLRLYYGFNQDEAIRAFREAARLDPGCAMAWWGVAIAAGPNINMPMDEEHGKIALEAIGKAAALAPKARAADQAYIGALRVRYAANPAASRAGLDSAYCDAMRKLAKRYSDDADAGALFAESLLDLSPWNQWDRNGQPYPGTLEAVAALERVLKQRPEHPGANHFYIHAVEASPDPARANQAAKRLETLVPGAGHLVHMPSHIYARTGRYDQALEQNRRAVAVDERYIAAQKPSGMYPLMYYNHNVQFIWFSALMMGRSAEALAAARKVAANVPPEVIAQIPMIEFVPPMPVLTLVRFGRWDEALKEPMPPASARFATAISHYARGVAFAATDQMAPARAALDSVRAIAATTPADMAISINFAAPLLRIASHALSGEIAARGGHPDEGIQEFRSAVAAEDSLHYDEPPTWYYPVRHSLGKALLEAGRAKEAEAVYREDLERHPENGWSLFGLSKALEAQHRAQEAQGADARFKTAWSQADVKLAASAF